MTRKNSLFLLLILTALSLACSLVTKTLPATPTPDYIFPPVRTPLLIEPASMPDAQVSVEYEAEIHITQNVTPVGDMMIQDGALPVGLEFIFLDGEDAAKIVGIPEEIGEFHFTVFAWCYGTQVSGQTLKKEYQLIVSDPEQSPSIK